MLLSWARNTDNGESAGETHSSGEGRGSYLTSPQSHSFRLKEIKSILAKGN